MTPLDQRHQVVSTQYNAEHITVYAPVVPQPLAPEVLAAAIQQLAALPLETIPNPAPLPEGSRLPFHPNPLFVGREAELCRLAQVLKGNHIAAIGPMAAATGLGGLGKTQLAVEFAHRYGQYFMGGVFWLNCANPEVVLHEVAACGGAGGMQLRPDFSTLPLDDQVRLVQRAWQSPLPRLLVFDNCEHQELITRWRPVSGACRVLVTSRRASWEVSLGITTLALDVLPRAKSLALLRQFCVDLAPNDPDLDSIAAEVGDLPLALHLAGSFLARYRQAVTPAAYLAELRQPDLLAHRSLQGRTLTRELSPTGHEQHVARTFKLSYDHLDPADATDARALTLLARTAYFAPGQPIQRDLLLATVAGTEETPETAVQAEDALRRLLDLGLLEANVTGAVRLHRLLAVFVRAVAQDAAAQTAVEDALVATTTRLLNAGYPGPLLALYPHLRAVADTAQPQRDMRAVRLDTVLGISLARIGDYAGAQPTFERALALSEQLFGVDHPEVAATLNNLASLYREQGHYAEIEPLYQRVLAVRERVLGSEHPHIAESVNNLAVLYHTQGRYGEAEPLYQRALAIGERVLGPDHPDVATTLNNLAALYRAQGRYGKAEPLYQRALAIGERVLGPDHPDVATTLNNLGNLYWTQDRNREAEPLYQRALAIRERVLGPDHPDVATTLNNLANCYNTPGRNRKAEPLYQRALAIRERVLGPDHPDVAMTLNNLASVYKTGGRCAEAEPLCQRALTIQERVLGPDHRDVAVTLINLADLCEIQGHCAGAEPLHQRALAIWQRVLGPDHPDIARTLIGLATFYWAQGRCAEAEPLCQRALALYEQSLGPADSHMAVVRLASAIAQNVRRKMAPSTPLWDWLRFRVAVMRMTYPLLRHWIRTRLSGTREMH